MTRLIDRLFDGPLDIVGDVHGEIEPLAVLLEELGYDDDGRHAGGRRLVFLGDLVDRGPDSPAVLELVMRLVAGGRAQCILGNHELNLLRNVRKHGNDWYTAPQEEDEFEARSATPEQKIRFHDFLQRLPVALEHEQLRVVHACWNAEAVAALAAHDNHGGALAVYRRYEDAVNAHFERDALTAARAREAERHGQLISQPETPPPLLEAHARMDVEYQMGNPIRVLTSGEEAVAAEPFWSAGKWRFVQRQKWWERYDEAQPVIIGHYWRRFSAAVAAMADTWGPDLFEGIEPHHWMGPRDNVYCVDFSAGGKSWAHKTGLRPEHFKLAAFRWPEGVVVHDDGHSWEVAAAADEARQLA